MQRDRDDIIRKLVEIQYDRNEIDFKRGKFRARGDVLEIFPASSADRCIRVEFFGDEIERLTEIDSLTGEVLGVMSHAAIFPASHYATTRVKMEKALVTIEEELEVRLKELKDQGKLLEALRILEQLGVPVLGIVYNRANDTQSLEWMELPAKALEYHDAA
jgi:excinuclease ABC subunit B